MRAMFIAAVLVFLFAASATKAGSGSGDPRLEELYTAFVSPCCWRDNLMTHDSGTSRALRARIQAMVADGRSDEEIKSALVAEFGQRILVVPEGSKRTWLFWTPWVLAAAGLVFVVIYLRRLRHPVGAPVLEAADTTNRMSI